MTRMKLPALGLLLGTLPAAAMAQEKPAEAAPAAPAAWADTLKFSGHLEVGATFNPDDPSNHQNFGHLFTDRANRLLLNQLLLTAERPLDPKATGYDFGFKLQAMYGSDARYTHFIGELDRSISDTNQVDIVEANILNHLPILTAGGIDLKLGQYSTPLGFEVIDAAANPFYSHSYIFNFGIPLKHTGGLAVTHLTDMIDLYLGADTGVNTSIGKKGDNNGALAGIGGFGLNMMDGKLSVVALTHIGPELPRGTANANVNKDLRYLNDVYVTWKPTDTLQFTTEFNYIRDDGAHAIGYGGAQYVIYTLSEEISLAARGEVWRDNNGFFVAAFPGNLDFVNAERGFPAQVIGGGRTTYGALTLGVSYKPPVPKAIEGFVLRPELRFDRSLNGTTPFDAGTKTTQVTFGMDAILPF
jgi:hypothetical protein